MQWPLLGGLSGGPCWGPLASWGPGAEEPLTAPGSPPTSNPKSGQLRPCSLAWALRLPRPPTMAGIKWDVCGCGLRTYSPCQELGEVLRLPQRTEQTDAPLPPGPQ